MRWAALAVAAVTLAGCGVKIDFPQSAGRPAATGGVENRAPTTGDSAGVAVEPATDRDPPRFDAFDAPRTLRWIATLTEPARGLALNRRRRSEQGRAVQSVLADCLGKTVKWKLPVGGAGPDGSVAFTPLVLTAIPDRSPQHPQMSLTVRPWNAPRPESPFMCPPGAGLSRLVAGQDSLTLQGVVTGITTTDNYNWFVSLYEIQISSATAPAAPPEAAKPPADGFDSADAEKAFAWLRHEHNLIYDPLATPEERKRRTRDLAARVRALAGTKVRWRWPTGTLEGSRGVARDLTAYDYPMQLPVVMSLWLRQAAASGKSGQAAGRGGSGFGREFILSTGPGAPAGAADKIGAVDKSTVSGTVSLITSADGGTYPPHVLEIAVKLDDAVVEP